MNFIKCIGYTSAECMSEDAVEVVFPIGATDIRSTNQTNIKNGEALYIIRLGGEEYDRSYFITSQTYKSLIRKFQEVNIMIEVE